MCASQLGVEDSAVINETSILLRWNPWISIRKYLLKVSVENMWSKLAKASRHSSWKPILTIVSEPFWGTGLEGMMKQNWWGLKNSWYQALRGGVRVPEKMPGEAFGKYADSVAVETRGYWKLQGHETWPGQWQGWSEGSLAWNNEEHESEMEKRDCQSLLFRGRRLYCGRAPC